MAELGRTLTEMPLLGTWWRTGLLQRIGDDELLPALARGERRASVVLGDGVELDGDSLKGTADWVLDAESAAVLIVGVGDRVAIVEADASGVTIDPGERFDPSLNLATVTFAGAKARVIEAGSDQVEWAGLLAQLLLAAHLMTGTGRAALGLGVEYAKERYAFARPIGSFQAIKHGLVEVLRRLELAEVLVRDAAAEAGGDADALRTPALSARVAADRAIDIATRTCMSVHGGIGVTWEHDARRSTSGAPSSPAACWAGTTGSPTSSPARCSPDA